MTDFTQLNKLIEVRKVRANLSRLRLAGAGREKAQAHRQEAQANARQDTLQTAADTYVRSRLRDATHAENGHSTGTIFQSIALGNATTRADLGQACSDTAALRADRAAADQHHKACCDAYFAAITRTDTLAKFAHDKMTAAHARRQDAIEETQIEDIVGRVTHGTD